VLVLPAEDEEGDMVHHFRSAAVAAALLLLTTGCTTRFRPLNADPLVRTDLASAEYDLTESTHNVGDAQVWVEPTDEDSGLIRLGLRLRNEATLPLALDLADTSLEVRTVEGRLFVVDELAEVVGEPTIPPRQTGRLELAFSLPPGVALDDLAGFELIWAVETDDGVRVVRSTAFARETWAQSRRRIGP
jgi:hypothetical protein